jgi:hypothetical protein
VHIEEGSESTTATAEDPNFAGGGPGEETCEHDYSERKSHPWSSLVLWASRRSESGGFSVGWAHSGRVEFLTDWVPCLALLTRHGGPARSTRETASPEGRVSRISRDITSGKRPTGCLHSGIDHWPDRLGHSIRRLGQVRPSSAVARSHGRECPGYIRASRVRDRGRRHRTSDRIA